MKNDIQDCIDIINEYEHNTLTLSTGEYINDLSLYVDTLLCRINANSEHSRVYVDEIKRISDVIQNGLRYQEKFNTLTEEKKRKLRNRNGKLQSDN